MEKQLYYSHFHVFRVKSLKVGLDIVTHVCNTNYLGGRGRRPAQGKSSGHYVKNKTGWGHGSRGKAFTEEAHKALNLHPSAASKGKKKKVSFTRIMIIVLANSF
jgi:hypothetical protein